MSRTSKAYRNTARAGDDSESTDSRTGSDEDDVDEEKTVGGGFTRVGRGLASAATMRSLRKGKKKRWTMRSQGKGYKATDAHTDTDSPPPSDDDSYSKAYADGGRGKEDRQQGPGSSADESDAGEPRHKKRGAAAGGAQDAQEEQAQEQGRRKKLFWVAGGLAVLVLILVVAGIYWWSNRDSSDSDSDSSSSSSSSSTLASHASLTATTSATAAPVATSSTAPTVAATNNQSAAPTVTSRTTPAVTTSAKPNPSSTDSALVAGTTYAAQIKWFEADTKVTECKTQPNDGDYVVKVSPEVFGSTSGVSSVCGTWITLYQLEKDAYTRATIEGLCADCTGHNLILSQATFNALTQDMKLGTTLAQFWLTDADHEPKRSLKSVEAAAQATASMGGGTDQGGSGDMTILPVAKSAAVNANGAASMAV